MFVVDRNRAISTQKVEMFSGLRRRILRELAQQSSHPRELARRLGVNEQKVYYHVRQLSKQGLIEVSEKKEIGGAAAKVYRTTADSFFTPFGNFTKTNRTPKESRFLRPFVEKGTLNSILVVGSPDPHGPERARSRDIGYAVDLGMFLGTFMLEYEEPGIIQDTDVRSSDYSRNMILIGGPITNRITKRFNDSLPVRFNKKMNIYSPRSRRTYKNPDNGFIVKTKNPQSGAALMVIAGKRYSGTRAAVLTFLRKFGDLEKQPNRVVRGIDMDGDGEVDEVEILE